MAHYRKIRLAVDSKIFYHFVSHVENDIKVQYNFMVEGPIKYDQVFLASALEHGFESCTILIENYLNFSDKIILPHHKQWDQ